MKQARELGYPWAVVLVPHQGGRQEQSTAPIELLDTLNIEKVYVLGASAGGTPAIRFALDYPERASGIILLSSAPSGIKSCKSCRACGTCLCSKPQLPNMTASPLLSTDLLTQVVI
ncbi:alpha/beta fold hydrolase [Rothia aeria]|uniref:alpha/beta fold hydrolase n=1 Tax=Rothia aeria TaxID=172042 RepID=UPI0036F2E60D